MITQYKILFMIELLNDYYANQQCKDFDVIPSRGTRELLRDRQILTKAIGNKLFALVKTQPDGPDVDKPYVSLNKADKFLFYLQLNRPLFNVVTNLDSDRLGAGRRYYFTNLHKNAIDSRCSLTAQIQPVVGPADYIPGDFTANGTTVYECIKSTNEANNPPNAGFWHDRGINQYVSGRDMLPIRTRVSTFKNLTPASFFSIAVEGLDIATDQYTLPVPIANNTFISPQDTSEVLVNLSELQPGRYKVTINGQAFEVFIDDAAVYNNVFGVIEIFSHHPDGSAFSFFDSTGKVKDKIVGTTPEWLRYKIQFANRMAYWKYNTPRHGVVSIDGGSLYSFVPTPAAGNKDFFTSDKPIPLLESPWKFKVNVQSLSNSEDPFAPNPDATVSGMLTRKKPEKDYYCSITLNY